MPAESVLFSQYDGALRFVEKPATVRKNSFHLAQLKVPTIKLPLFRIRHKSLI